MPHTSSAPAPHVPGVARTTPKDFFLWLGAIIALYGSITAFITLLYQYVDYAFPDALASYADPYGAVVRTSMASLIVLAPTCVILFRLIRRNIVEDASRADIWVRKWALVLTIFIATATILIDLITLLNTFLGGEITTRFGLKVLIILLVAVGIFLHFLADLKGYWALWPRRANAAGIAFALVALVAVVAGFFIIGTPQQARLLRYDEQKISDLQNIQYQVLNYWQLKRSLPASLDTLTDPLSGYNVPADPQAGDVYEYTATGPLAFKLCATFNRTSADTKGRGSYPGDSSVVYPSYGDPQQGNFTHAAGHVCFDRTIDPERYPVVGKPI
ncbi:MAG: DUF5671 domain-containing protein [Patescibacteria group bacterium]